MASAGSDAGNGIAFLVSAGIVAEIVAKACSSPQTTELNAGARAATLMKWVTIGMVEAAAFVIIAAAIDPKHRVPIILGGLTEGVITLAEYVHGKRAGLASDEPGTESY
jgi:preprotein translocase subunit SecY